MSDKNETSYSFKIPLKGCGTSKVNIDIEEESVDIKGFENIIVIQNNPHYQAINDSVRMIVCRYTEQPMESRLEREDKRVLFKPFTVDMLDVITVPMSGLRDNHQVSCWMDITRGHFPDSKPIDGPVKVGENLTMAIYIKDKRETTDLRVKDCFAYDSREDAVRGGKPIIMLTSDQGCPLNHKLIDYWKTTTSTGSSGASVVAFTTISAFKFPEKENVFLSCNVELCTNGCLTFCSDDPNSHTLSPAFHSGLDSVANHNSPVHRHLANVSFVTTTVSTSTPATVTDEREREFDFLNHKLPQRSRVHRIMSGSGPSNFATASHETEEAEDVDVILNGALNPKADFARLVFQGTDTPMNGETGEPESRVGDIQESTTTTPEGAETTTTPDDDKTTTTESPTTSLPDTTMTPTTQSPDSTEPSSMTTTPAEVTTQSSDFEVKTTESSDSSETTTGKVADLQQTKQSNTTEEESVQQQRPRQGKAKSQELDDDKDDEDISVIKPVLNAGVKGGSGSQRRVKKEGLRRFPSFLPRPPAANRRKKEDRIGLISPEASSSSSTSTSGRRRRTNSSRIRRRDPNRRSRNSNRRRKLVSQASNRDISSNSERGWKMEPLPSHLDPGFADIPFRASRQSRRYLRPPPNQSFSHSSVSSYHRRA